METINTVGIGARIGCFLIGWNPILLKQCGEASRRTLRRYISAIIILSVIWGAIGFCFAERYMGVSSLWQQLAVSSVFVIMILCIERFIILTVGKLGIMGFFRYVLAFLMAVLGSAVFDQIIFKNDVTVKMKEVRTEQINKEIPKRMDYLDSDIKRVSLLIDSIGLANIQIYDKLSKQPIITATDVSTTTKQTGVDEEGNPVVEKITSVNKRSVENPLNAQAKANEEALNLYKNQLDTYQKEKIEVADKTRDEFENAATGFLEELKALVLILREDPYALAFYIFLFLFLLCLELLVVTSKTGDSKCDYDLVVEHQLRIKAETLRNTELSLLNKQKEG